MKKVFAIIMALAIAMSLAVPAFAYDGSAATTTKSWTSWWDHWKNPTPTEPTTPSEPEAEIGVPTITEARFYHSSYVTSLKNRLQISWNAVDKADSYEIEVMKAAAPPQPTPVPLPPRWSRTPLVPRCMSRIPAPGLPPPCVFVPSPVIPWVIGAKS